MKHAHKKSIIACRILQRATLRTIKNSSLKLMNYKWSVKKRFFLKSAIMTRPWSCSLNSQHLHRTNSCFFSFSAAAEDSELLQKLTTNCSGCPLGRSRIFFCGLGRDGKLSWQERLVKTWTWNFSSFMPMIDHDVIPKTRPALNYLSWFFMPRSMLLILKIENWTGSK